MPSIRTNACAPEILPPSLSRTTYRWNGFMPGVWAFFAQKYGK